MLNLAYDDVSSPPVPAPTSMTSSLVKLAFLQEMFPSVPVETITEVARRRITTDDAVDELVSQSNERSHKTLEQVLRKYRGQVNTADD